MTQPKFMIVSINILPCWASKDRNSLFTVEGSVISSYAHLPLAGTHVSVKGCNDRVAANHNGQFVIRLSQVPATLVFSADGFVKQEITLVPPRDAPLLITMTNYRLTNDHKELQIPDTSEPLKPDYT